MSKIEFFDTHQHAQRHTNTHTETHAHKQVFFSFVRQPFFVIFATKKKNDSQVIFPRFSLSQQKCVSLIFLCVSGSVHVCFCVSARLRVFISKIKSITLKGLPIKGKIFWNVLTWDLPTFSSWSPLSSPVCQRNICL